jgi:hypothetical protein
MANSGKRPVSTSVLTRQTILALGALIAVPLLFYPKRLGLPLFELSPVVSLVEWLFYLAVFSLIGSRLPGSTRVLTAGFTVISRLGLGMILGSIVAWTHSMPWTKTVAEMMWSYPLSLVLHLLLAPVVLLPVWEHLMTQPSSLKQRRRVVGLAPSRPRPVRPIHHASGSRTTVATKVASASDPAQGNVPGMAEPTLDDAVSYVGEYQGVRMCWVVDHEGLPLAVWQRQQYSADADFWAPVSVEAADFHRKRLSAEGACRPQRIEVRTDQGRLIAEAVGDYWLGVLADPDADDLISIRLSRALEMTANYLQKAGRAHAGAGEAHYV